MAVNDTIESINSLPNNALYALIGIGVLILVFLLFEQYFIIALIIEIAIALIYLNSNEPARQKLFEIFKLPKKALHAVISIAAMLILFFFFRKIFNIFLVLAVILIIIFVFAKMFFGQPSAKELFRKKKELLLEIGLIEKKFMKREFDQKTFDELFKTKQRELIDIEAKIDSITSKRQMERNISSDVSAKKQHLLQELWNEKRHILNTIQIAEKKYFTRKIDEKMYKTIVQMYQEKLVRTEAKIKILYSEDNAEKVIQDLKAKLKQVEEEMRAEQANNQEQITEALLSGEETKYE